jgi:hypothetical protein
MTVTAAICFIDMDVRNLPVLWEELLRQALNDYICLPETSNKYIQAENWLFYEEYDEDLDGYEFVDVCGFHTACKAFSLDSSKVRFDAQRIRDLNDNTSCPKGRRQGFITTRRFGDLICRWRKP